MSNQKEINVELMPMLNIGMVGHIDHGKTTLLQKLTGKFADTHSEELKRGITIKLGYAELILNETDKKPRYISFVDAPGHEMLMATMLSGAAMMDAAILVIAANEGIKPQTKEHLIALQAKNVKNIIIVQNKIDLVDKKEAVKNYEEIKNFVKGTIAENSKIIPVSAQQGVNIDEIKKELLELEIPNRNEKGDPIFLIARSFDINKPGTDFKKMTGGIIAGILKQGTLNVGDNIEIKPGIYEKKANQFIYQTVKTKVMGIRRGNHIITTAKPGGSLAIETELDNIVTKTDNLSGNIIGINEKLPEISKKIKIKFKIFNEKQNKDLKTEDSLKVSEEVMLSINTTTTIGIIERIKEDEAIINLKIPIVPLKSAGIGIARNTNNHWRLIGCGELIE